MQADPEFEVLFPRVQRWIEADPDPVTRAEAELLLEQAQAGDAAAAAQLHDAFTGALSFGTAGLRAELGAGPRRMNRVVVARSSAGLAAFLLERAARGEAADPPSVVIGHDARVNSQIFARDTAEVLAGAGIRVSLFPTPVPTPLTAFAVRQLAASAGVMITASHNPPRDNGYKVYLGDRDGGSQIVRPVDGEIAELIAQAADLDFDEIPKSERFETLGPEVHAAYIARVAEAVRAGRRAASGTSPASTQPADTSPVSTSYVYTAMHGVGAATMREVVRAAGLPDPISVEEQEQPDGSFPTLEYPNPEESGALNLAYRLASQRVAEIVIANDPDADRLGVAVRHPDEPRGFRRLSGNQIGLLLGWRAAEQAQAAGRTGTLANTVVSSPVLRAVAEHYGLDHVETLSGSKWLARVPHLIFGFEEALGYLVHPGIVGDKDGIGAAAEIIALASECSAANRTLWEMLDEASLRFGHFASRQIVVRFDRAAQARTVTERVRADPPLCFGDFSVTRVRDFRTPGLAATTANVLAYDLEGGSRVMIRPSGTEPKLKVYLDARVDSGSLADRTAQADRALLSIEASARQVLEEFCA